MDLRICIFTILCVNVYCLSTLVNADHLLTRARSAPINNQRSGHMRSMVDQVGRPMTGRFGRQVGYTPPRVPASFTQRLWQRRRFSPWVMPRQFQQLVADRIKALRDQAQSNTGTSVVLKPSPQPATVLAQFTEGGVIPERLPKQPFVEKRVNPTVVATIPKLSIAKQDKVIAIPTIPWPRENLLNPTVVATQFKAPKVKPDSVKGVAQPVPVIIKEGGIIKPGTLNTNNKPSIPAHSHPGLVTAKKAGIVENIQTPAHRHPGLVPAKEAGIVENIQLPAHGHPGIVTAKEVGIIEVIRNPQSLVTKNNGQGPIIEAPAGDIGRVRTHTGHSRVVGAGLTGQDTPALTSTSIPQAGSLLQLLNDRQPGIRDKHDEAELKRHLMALKDMQNSNGLLSTDQRLIRMQLEYIDSIQESAIKRETLKLIVKDIVEKSGFLIQAEHTSADIKEMTSLLELINSISNRRVVGRTTTPLPVIGQPRSSSLRSRIGAGLDMNSFQKSSQMPDTVPGVDLNHLVGLSIYGDRQSSGKTDTMHKTSVKTTQHSTTLSPNFEPVGGTDAYWTHLSAGFQDMLCSLCQQRGHQSCINRYCQNNV